MSLVRIYTTSSTSPIVSLYGDAGDHETILRYLDGWYGTPDAKVDLTERASGDGAHDVSKDEIQYGARTITADYRILSDSRGKLLQHESELLSLAHQNVRFRVTDDASDLFASGYVDSVVKDKSQQNLAKQTETGTLTIVCPRPERLAWSPLQSQLFPVSVMQGGLRYSTVHQLVSAWTGTADASTSTLSQDGTVIATNYFLNPALRDSGARPNVINGSITQVGTNSATIKSSNTIDSNTIQYRLTGFTSGETMTFVVDFSGTSGKTPNPVGSPRAMVIRQSDLSWLGNVVSYPADGHGVISAVVPSDGVLILDIVAPQDLSAITISNVGIYTQSDYNALLLLGVDWFSGASYPVPTGKGLSYPLNYGTGGVASNVALLLNQGSSKAFPVLTVTGSFPNGIQIQWGGNALQYDGAIGAVPLILDSRSQTASMGGVDVSRNLSRRDFPTIPAAGSVSLRLMSAGTGWVTAVCRDTYI